MDIEQEVFKRTHLDFSKIEAYGFRKQSLIYHYEKTIMNNTFSVCIQIDKNGKIFGKIYDLDTSLEYVNFRIESQNGKFVNQVRDEYKKVLEDIRDCCCERSYFQFEQTNRVVKYIINKYGNYPEFLWDKSPDYGVFRNGLNSKWYAIIMCIDKSKLEGVQGDIEILNIKIDENERDFLLKQKGFYKAYHMNKQKWITITLDNQVKDSYIYSLIDTSYDLIHKKK